MSDPVNPKEPHPVFREGGLPVFWKSKEDPRKDDLTRTAAAAFAVGFDLPTKKSFTNAVTVDETRPLPEGEEPERSVTWIWDGKQTVEFKPIAEAETINIQEFRTRFEDLEWVAANPDHPISHMRAFLEQSRRTMERIHALPPSLKIVRGDRAVLAPHDATDEEIEEKFADLADEIGG